MNDENRDELVEETGDSGVDDAAAGLVAELQEEVDQLQEESDATQEQLRVALDRVQELEAAPAVAAAPAGDADLRALASTVRTAQRNGHPDAAKHLEALLSALGA